MRILGIDLGTTNSAIAVAGDDEPAHPIDITQVVGPGQHTERPPRPTARTPRREPLVRRPWEPIGIAETTTSLYKRPSLLRRLWAIVAGSGLAIVIGTVLAIVIAFGTGFLVITLTDLPKR